MTKLTDAEISVLKQTFEKAGCSVRALDRTSFEIVSEDLPVTTHVFVTPYYLQLATVIHARPRRITARGQTAFFEFLNTANKRAKVAKFTTDSRTGSAKSYVIMATVKLITGTVGGDYTAKALNNLVTLFLIDIAEFMAARAPFRRFAMIPES